MLFDLPEDSGLDPLLPFDVVLMIAGTDAEGNPLTVELPIAYQLPERHMLLPPPPPVPMWVETWREKQVDIAILGFLPAQGPPPMMLLDYFGVFRTPSPSETYHEGIGVIE